MVCSSDFEIGYDTVSLTIRFGYWNSDLDGLKKLYQSFNSYRKLVDDDDDCGRLYNYEISDKRFDN